MESDTYLKKNWNFLLQSFKQFCKGKPFFESIVIGFFDFLCWLIIIAPSFVFLNKIAKRWGSIDNLPWDKILQMSESFKPFETQVKSFINLFIVGSILVIVLSFVAFCVFAFLIWSMVSQQKIKQIYMIKFFILNIIWFAAWTGASAILFILVKRELIAPLLILILLILAHFTNILYSLFPLSLKFRSMIDALKIGTKKIHLFMIPYLVIFLGTFLTIIIFIIFSQIYYITKILPETIFGVSVEPIFIFIPILLLVIVWLAYLVWARIYFFINVKSFYNSLESSSRDMPKQ
jgi:hypothetical protein